MQFAAKVIRKGNTRREPQKGKKIRWEISRGNFSTGTCCTPTTLLQPEYITWNDDVESQREINQQNKAMYIYGSTTNIIALDVSNSPSRVRPDHPLTQSNWAGDRAVRRKIG